MTTPVTIDTLLSRLNPQQRAAATHGDGPLLIVAGAGTGKTATLVHRVAWLIARGVEPSRILLLTFTRRAATEMLRRTDALLGQLSDVRRQDDAPPEDDDASEPTATASLQRPRISRVWGGTYHAIATRLLRRFGKTLGLPPAFTIHDRGDSEDLMNVVRTELNLAKTDKRFPKKGTCMDVYSRCVNAQIKLEQVLETAFPWCRQWIEELKKLFDGYTDHKEAAGILDYDDLLLYWRSLLQDPPTGDRVRGLFDCVLVDEYQDTNTLQADILRLLSPEGRGVTVVGDDAQSIYAFRAATVRNILDFPKQFVGTTVVTLEQNYRSTQPILDATNGIISLARERFTKNLWSERTAGVRPRLVHCEDEEDQADYLIRRILTHREEGIDLRRQAVLFRASHHSMLLEAELARRDIPFHKYGGLKFVETAHVKDLLAFLRLAENPRDVVSGMRILPLLPGIGPGKAGKLLGALRAAGGNLQAWREWTPPAEAREIWPKFVKLLQSLVETADALPTQIHRVRKFYAPLLEGKFDNSAPRLRDLEQLELIASRYRNRGRFLTALTLDPPSSTQDLAGDPILDDDYLVLSTIHSAKGLEWDAVYVIHASDGNIPSDMAAGSPEEIEEERRLFYVALTRAKNHLYVSFPMKYYSSPWMGARHGFAQRTRFLPDAVLERFTQCVSEGPESLDDDAPDGRPVGPRSRSIRGGMKRLWS
ncbi:MAG: ATP-dependent helicase [Pirellulales bacterium]|nr:ATP-dependent helicase [Pirellulales bacterium]